MPQDIDRLCAALRDAAVFAASRQRRSWKIGWEEAADQIVISIEPDEVRGDSALLRVRFTSLGVEQGQDIDWPIQWDEVWWATTERIGDVAAEFWRVDPQECGAELDGTACRLKEGHSGRHRATGPNGDVRWGSRRA